MILHEKREGRDGAMTKQFCSRTKPSSLQRWLVEHVVLSGSIACAWYCNDVEVMLKISPPCPLCTSVFLVGIHGTTIEFNVWCSLHAPELDVTQAMASKMTNTGVKAGDERPVTSDTFLSIVRHP